MYVYLRDPKTIECCGRVEWHTKSRQLHGADHPSSPILQLVPDMLGYFYCPFPALAIPCIIV